jgi:hypothetical protein
MSQQAEAVKHARNWRVKKEFFEKCLTEYRNDMNGSKEDCMVIFFDAKTGNFAYRSSAEDGGNLTPMQLVGVLEIVKSSVFQDSYVAD